MIFSTFEFIFLFLPIVWLSYFGLHKAKFHTAAKWFLVASSFAFYAIGSADFVLIFALSVALNFLIGTKIARMANGSKAKTMLFLTGILLNVALLGYYKYTDFFIANYNFLFGANVALKKIVLPIGISFFTFQLIAFQVDSFRGLTSSYSFLDYLLFITFFPQLIVGPIVHHGEMVPQFEDSFRQCVNWDNVAKGLFVFTIGVAKKILLADPLTTNAQSFFDVVASPVGAASAWYYAVEYTISYYFDLSAYADMAIGIGLLFNVIIPENFNSPYKARNFQDYWQRWHMTLSRFLGSYIFRSVYRKGSRFRTYYVATMVTFFVSGFWHGAGWTFVVWGVVNGILVCIASAMKRHSLSLPTIPAHILTLLGVVLTRILFVAKDFHQAGVVFQSLFNFGNHDFFVKQANGIYNKIAPISFVFSIFIIAFMPNTKALSDRFKPTWSRLVPLALAAGLSVALMGRASQFLYFQF